MEKSAWLEAVLAVKRAADKGLICLIVDRRRLGFIEERRRLELRRFERLVPMVALAFSATDCSSEV